MDIGFSESKSMREQHASPAAVMRKSRGRAPFIPACSAVRLERLGVDLGDEDLEFCALHGDAIEDRARLARRVDVRQAIALRRGLIVELQVGELGQRDVFLLEDTAKVSAQAGICVPVNGERLDPSTLLYASAVVAAVIMGQRMRVKRGSARRAASKIRLARIDP
jgi:hypothetical protein